MLVTSDRVALPDLPMAWLHRLSTSLTAESAARLRSTCTLLQQVIDATWEPVEVEVPPHRRSVPLTWEQVQAQLPPEEVWDSEADDDDEEDWYGRKPQDGCAAWALDLYGPALTRLTANQAVNTLKGKAVLCWLRDGQGMNGRDSTVADRMEELEQLQFFRDLTDGYERWPPPANLCDADSGCDCECQGKPEQGLRGGRVGTEWGEFFIDYVTPEPLREREAQRPYSRLHEEPHKVCVYTCCSSPLLFKTSSSCREATADEVYEFVWSTAASDGDRFDFYLSHGGDAQNTYVFLAPSELRLTGRVKACLPPTAAVSLTPGAVPV